jgi:FKBP-type peptidyl-prolyl cis-trans isomerase SlyD
MIIDKNTVATLVYSIRIKDADGEIIEDVQKEPREMLFGFDKMISGFESNLKGLTTGNDFNFSLNAEQSFGEYRDDMVVNVPKQAFMVDGALREDLVFVGNEISMMDNSGRPLRGKVVEIMEESVKMDFNHPLAGEGLHVSGSVLGVREMTPADIEPKSTGCGSGCGCSSEGDHDHSGGGCSTEKDSSSEGEGGCCGSGCGC